MPAVRAADQKVFVADFRQATADFSWAPQVAHRQGLAEMLEWSRGLLQVADGPVAA